MRLDSLLKISKLEEDEINEKIQSLKSIISSIDNEIDSLKCEISTCELIISNPNDILLVKQSLDYISTLRNNIDSLNTKKSRFYIQLDELNIIYINKKSERKGFEKLIENQNKKRQKELEKKENLFLDELNILS